MIDERATTTNAAPVPRRAPTAARVVLAMGLVVVAAALVVTALETASPPMPGPVEVASGVDPGEPGTGDPLRVEPLGPQVLAPDQADPTASATASPTTGVEAPPPPTSGSALDVPTSAPRPGPSAIPDPGTLLEDPTALLDPVTSPPSTLLPPLLDPDEALVVPLPGPDLTVPLLPGIDPELGGLGDLLRPR